MKLTLKLLLTGIIAQMLIPSLLPANPVICYYLQPDSIIVSDSMDYDFTIKIHSFDLPILPPSSGIQFYRDGIIFMSVSKNEKRMIPEHISFGIPDIYYSIPDDSTVGIRTVFSAHSPFPYPVEAFTFTNDYSTMYYAKTAKKDKKEKIFKAEYFIGDKKQTGWISDNNPLSFCTGDHTYTHPALSSDGKLMVFASDRDGSAGGMDLYLSHYEEDQWTEPRNLGYLINTEGNEAFPFLDAENNLFFSSDGLPGYGGYDLFMSKFNGVSWEEPVNLSGQINSENDEFAIKINKIDGKTAYFSGKLLGDNNKIQLFRISLDSLTAMNDTIRLSNILYTTAYARNEFPSRKLMAFIDTARIIPPEIVDTFKLFQKDIIITSIDELKMHIDTIEIKVVEAPPKEQFIPVKKLSAKSSDRPPGAGKTVAEVTTPKTSLFRDSTVVQPEIPLMPIVTIVEPPTEETLLVEEKKSDVSDTEPLIAKTLPVEEKPHEAEIQAIPEVSAVESEITKKPLTGNESIAQESIITDLIEESKTEITDIISKESSDVIIYKVQIRSAVRPLGNFGITVNNRYYVSSEYFYKKEYRYTVGEFGSFRDALELKRACRRSGYPDAFIASFINNVRSPELVIPPFNNKLTGQQRVNVTDISSASEKKDIITYKVQVRSSVRPLTNWQITVNGILYYTNEYFYKNEYRYTIGEFNRLEPAAQLQNACRTIGYPKAFVAAFKNNLRSLDPALFKKK